MKGHLQSGGPGFAKTHPPPDARIADVKSKITGGRAVETANAARQNRFAKALKSI
jgi:predicted Zn-dependent protease